MRAPTRLPIIRHEDKRWFLDARLRQIRNVDDPHDLQNLNDFELDFFGKLAADPADRPSHVIWKDEGRDDDGRSIGPAHTEDASGALLDNYGWITWKEADQLARALGLVLEEV